MPDDVKFTLLDLLHAYSYITVPIIQRDYVQGRKNEESETVRKNLLADMKSAIEADSPQAYLDLNFVYGKVIKTVCENNLLISFIPVDGQQRLTTLFLLHLFAYSDEDDKTKLFLKFSYETRATSRIFLTQFIEHRKEIFMAAIPSLEIEEASWFITRWKNDPTVQSIAIMADAIKKTFHDKTLLKQRLEDQQHRCLFFHFLEMEQVGQADSLYIKLNARGKPLSGFENLKAGILGQLRKIEKDEDYIFEFEQNLDGKWTDFFWRKYRSNLGAGAADFDLFYKNFFLVFLYTEFGQFVSKEIYDTNVSAIKYSNISSEMIETMSDMLNFLCKDEIPDAEKVFVLNALDSNSSHSDRVLFYVVKQYISKTPQITENYSRYASWRRIFNNLVRNTQIDELDSCRKAIDGISKVSAYWNDIESYLATGGPIFGFNSEQLKEEQQKASLILADKDFRSEIIHAEEHQYFSGQIRSALYLSGNDTDGYSLSVFKNYWTKISMLFDSEKPKFGNLLRRALLAFGDYRMVYSSYLTLCQDDPNINIHNSSLKDLFSSNNECVKQLLDMASFSKDIPLKSQLEQIIEKSKVPLDDWRSCFINDERLLQVSRFEGFRSKTYLRTAENYLTKSVVIIPNINSRGYNYDVFLMALALKLSDKKIKYSFCGSEGLYGDRWLEVEDGVQGKIRFGNKQFLISDNSGEAKYSTTSTDPLNEILRYILQDGEENPE